MPVYHAFTLGALCLLAAGLTARSRVTAALCLYGAVAAGLAAIMFYPLPA